MTGSRGMGSLRQIGGTAGIVFGLGVFLVFILAWDQPLASDPVGDIRSYAADNATRIFIANWLASALFVFPLLIFASALRSVLAGADEDSDMWARVSGAGAVITVAVAGVGSTVTSAIALNGDEYSDSTVRLLMYLDAHIFSTVVPWGFALFLSGASVVILRTGVLWRWLGWFGCLLSLVLVVGAAWLIDGDLEGVLHNMVWIGITLTLLWTLLVGVAMLRMKETSPVA